MTVVLAASLLSACGKQSEAPAAASGPAKVGVVVLQKQSQVLDTTLPGRTNAFLSAEVRPQVTGIVQKRLFTEGAIVKQGQPLYQLDASSLRAAEASAAAVLAKAETGAGGDDRERYRDYPSAAKEAPQYCVTNLTSAPGKSQTYEFYGLPDVNN